MEVKLKTVIHDLLECKQICELHVNKFGVEWATSLLVSLQKESISENVTKPPQVSSHRAIYDRHYLRAKNFILLGQYKRAVFNLENNQTLPIHNYLYYYAQYMSIETDRLDSAAESDSETSSISEQSRQMFEELLHQIENELKDFLSKTSWMHYIQGLVYLKLNKNDDAREAFLEAINLDPPNWPAWHELKELVTDRHHLKSINLPSHWFRLFFYGAVYNRLQMFEEAYDLHANVLGEYFSESVYVLCEMAKSQIELRDIEAANSTFKKARSLDPCRLDDMDVCSNTLYVSQRMYELASLAHTANEIEPYRLETCFCLANFYSLRGQHSKAAEFFSRALKLDPTNISAWILMGHEYMEMKSTEDAIKAYRSAINLDKNDHRAWYGLGQLYEILKLPNISLDHYLTAYKLKPNDARYVTALKEIYEKLGWSRHAETYRKRAQQQLECEELNETTKI